MSGCDPVVSMIPDPLNQTEASGFEEASDRLHGAISAMVDVSINFPSRELSLAITNAQQATLWLREASPDPWCRECGQSRLDVPEPARDACGGGR